MMRCSLENDVRNKRRSVEVGLDAAAPGGKRRRPGAG